MDAYERLRLEYEALKSIIFQYDSNGAIGNYVNRLGEAISTFDLGAIQYTIKKIIPWYNNNMYRIESNRFVSESGIEAHRCMFAFLSEMDTAFSNYTFDANTIAKYSKRNETTHDKLIFLSHKSNDSKYGNALRNFIIGLGVPDDKLIYTSHPLHKIPLDNNIYDYLRGHLNANVFVIILWSNAYLESPACLNEMGAAWVTQSDYTNVYVPDFSFVNPKYHECAVDTRKMGAVLNGDWTCETNMLELKNKIQDMFGLENDEKQTTYLLDQFTKEIGD